MTSGRSPSRTGALAAGAAAVAGVLTAAALASGAGSAAGAPATGAAASALARPAADAAGAGSPAGSADAADRAGERGTSGARPGCPTGALPRITLTGASFSPPLRDGTTFVPGRYAITLSGTVDDETGAGIDVRGVGLTIGGRPWTARPTVATRVAPQTSARLVVRGTYTATRTERVDLRSSLSWRWTDAAVTPCGTKGLVDDD